FDAWFDRVDANHDGAIDKVEFRADALRFFKQLDANGDGVIDGFELSAYEHKIAPELIAIYEGPATRGVEEHARAGGRRGAADARQRGAPERIQRLLAEAE